MRILFRKRRRARRVGQGLQVSMKRFTGEIFPFGNKIKTRVWCRIDFPGLFLLSDPCIVFVIVSRATRGVSEAGNRAEKTGKRF